MNDLSARSNKRIDGDRFNKAYIPHPGGNSRGGGICLTLPTSGRPSVSSNGFIDSRVEPLDVRWYQGCAGINSFNSNSGINSVLCGIELELIHFLGEELGTELSPFFMEL